MYVEDLKYACSDLGADKGDEVWLRMYGCGQEFLVPLTYNRFSLDDREGQRIVVIDVSDN